MRMNKLAPFLLLIRADLAFAAGICVVMGMILASDGIPSVWGMLLAFCSAVAISGGILAMNDYFDVESDRINAPDRPIPSGAISPGGALFFSIILIFGGIGLSAFFSCWSVFIASLLGVLGFLYNRYLKKTGLPGNFVVSISVGTTFIYGGLAVGIPFSPLVVFFAVLVALIDLGEEIAADAMDAEGDALIGSRSIARRYGSHIALRVSTVIFMVVILITPLPFLFGWFSLLYAIPLGIMDVFIAWCVFRLNRSANEDGRRYIKLLYRSGTGALVIVLVLKLLGW